jgi:WhiB family transcriptional regulator, redox-sensing transcriptional regulator
LKQVQQAKRHRGPADGGQKPLAVDPRDNSLVLLTTQATALDDPLPCHRENLQLWFSDHPADLQLAKAYCQPCPVRRVCLAGAVERHEPHGVWGGEIFALGAIITEKKPRGRPPRRAARPTAQKSRASSRKDSTLIGTIG